MVTQQGPYGGPQGPYGSFAGKVEQVLPDLPVTRLGLYGGPRGLYGSFAGKTLSLLSGANKKRRQFIKTLGRGMG